MKVVQVVKSILFIRLVFLSHLNLTKKLITKLCCYSISIESRLVPRPFSTRPQSLSIRGHVGNEVVSIVRLLDRSINIGLTFVFKVLCHCWLVHFVNREL